MKRVLATALAPLLLLAACDSRKEPSSPSTANATPATDAAPAKTTPAAAPNVATFQHDPQLDAFGYYFSGTPIKVGNWELSSLNIGAEDDFKSWEDGKRPATYAPIFLEFEDVTSPTAENELGQTYHTVSFRLLPESYRVNGQEVMFRAKDPRIGDVVFSGAFDLAALKLAKQGGPGGEEKPVLRGALRIGAKEMRNVTFSYFAGD